MGLPQKTVALIWICGSIVGTRVGISRSEPLSPNRCFKTSSKGETLRSKGLPGAKTDATQSTRQDSWVTPAMKPVLIRPHFFLIQVKATVPQMPDTAEAPMRRTEHGAVQALCVCEARGDAVEAQNGHVEERQRHASKEDGLVVVGHPAILKGADGFCHLVAATGVLLHLSGFIHQLGAFNWTFIISNLCNSEIKNHKSKMTES